MLSKVFLPAVARLSGQRAFTQLTRPVVSASRVSQAQSIFRNLRLGHAFSDLRVMPSAFMHSEAVLKTLSVDGEDLAALGENGEKKNMRFDQITAIEPVIQNTLKRNFRYEEMSIVQEAVLSKLPNERDMFVKAKTGTGKTLAFLIAAIQTAMDGRSVQDLKYFQGTSIMIISPTRELANQIAVEAEKLCSGHPFKVHCMVGGDSKRRQIMDLERRRCDIVVGTPGRLHDMLNSVRDFKNMCEGIKVLVLDEADQLLDMGFKQELQRIFNLIPAKRQTMLFSATMSRDIRDNLGKFALSSNYELIDTVGKDEVNTHMHIKQSALVAPYDEQLALIRNLLTNYDAANKGKVIVFLPTTKSTIIYSHLFKMLLPGRIVYEIHSKKTQDQRTRIADRFRRTNDGILFTSDVSARGVDYPGVTLVLQIGVPSTREQYIHRLGRTGRAGRDGEGIIVLAPFEKDFLTREVKDMPIEKLVAPAMTTEDMATTESLTQLAVRSVDDEMMREVYTGFLGFYCNRVTTLGHSRNEALRFAGDFMTGFGVKQLPHLSDSFLKQLGISRGGSSRGGGGGGFRGRDSGSRDGGFRGRDGGSRDGGFRSREGGFRSR
ncbi:P-loop containing nucleoside triphosphate hydrolase protein [Spinellus fusiger]|nr:P-loop containing nucleoside triphosphate hydrolase protein [Spinellus fusiger]